jgi:hypothetical protein
MNLVEKSVSKITNFLQKEVNLPDEARITLPVLLRVDGQYVVSIGYYRGEPGLVVGRPRKIYFPVVQGFAEAKGQSVRYQQIDPAAFGLKNATQFVGDLANIAKLKLDEFRTMKSEYYELLSNIIENDHLAETTSNRVQKSMIANKIKSLNFTLREPALKSYYAHFGKEFDAWLASL